MIDNPWPGKFIVLEGPDFVGKTSQLGRMKQWLKAHWPNSKLEFTKEPTPKYYGKVIRSMLGDKRTFEMIPEAARQTLFAVDSREHALELLLPRLIEQYVVMSDRYRLSSIAYGAQSEEDLSTFFEINRLVLGNSFLWPDATIILNISKEEYMRRKGLANRPFDGFEEESKFERIQDNYHALFGSGKFSNMHMVSAEGSKEEVFSRILLIVKGVLKIKEA